jgi:hypothetical protein
MRVMRPLETYCNPSRQTTNREGRRFESCRARSLKSRVCRNFAFAVEDAAGKLSTFDRSLTVVR